MKKVLLGLFVLCFLSQNTFAATSESAVKRLSHKKVVAEKKTKKPKKRGAAAIDRRIKSKWCAFGFLGGTCGNDVAQVEELQDGVWEMDYVFYNPNRHSIFGGLFQW